MTQVICQVVECLNNLGGICQEDRIEIHKTPDGGKPMCITEE